MNRNTILTMPSDKSINREKQLTLALEFLQQNPNTAIRAVARQFRVNCTTLQRRKNGKQTYHSGGQNRILSDPQKAALLQYIKAQAFAGFPVTLNMIFAIVETWRKGEGLQPPSSKWMQLFLKDIKKDFHIVKMKPMDSKRIVAQNPAVSRAYSLIRSWF